MSGPENTTKRDPGDHLRGLMLLGNDGYIGGLEKAGQEALVASTVIPVDGPIDELEALGVKLGPVDDADPIFRECELPDGWRREAGDGPGHFWSYLLDPQGRRRVSIFYKAAPYDRRAFFRITPLPEDEGGDA